MLTDDEEAPPCVDLGEKGAGTKMAIGNPQTDIEQGYIEEK